MYVTIEYNGKSYVKDEKDVTSKEHVSGVFEDVKDANKVALRIAKQWNLEYIPMKREN